MMNASGSGQETLPCVPGKPDTSERRCADLPRTLQLANWAPMTPGLEALAEGALMFPRRDAH